MKKIISGIISFAALFAILHFTGLDYRILRAVIFLNLRETSGRQEIRLNEYLLAKTRSISCLDNLSGITYSDQSKTFFLVADNPPKVYNIDKSGRCLREISLMFAIVEEKENRINIVEISDTATILDRSEVINSLQIYMKKPDNKGFEGIAYDEVKQRIYVVNEKHPKQLIAIGSISLGVGK